MLIIPLTYYLMIVRVQKLFVESGVILRPDHALYCTTVLISFRINTQRETAYTTLVLCTKILAHQSDRRT